MKNFVENQFCFSLNLGFDVDVEFINDIDIREISEIGFKQFKVQIEDLDQRLIKFLNGFQISIEHAEIFYTPPGNSLPIHVDGHEFSNLCKLNFVYGAPDSLMNWWAPKNPNKEPTCKFTEIGTSYIYAEENDCDLVWTSKIKFPTIVNAGQLHNVVNCTTTPRTALSLILYDLKKSQNLDWHDAAIIFKKYTINI
jgi:hypothetical protein